jgi:hypothetical protein
MCTYNGAPYLQEQLDSFAEQTHSNWKLWVSDDGSHDETLNILEKTAAQWGSDKLTIFQGPRRGYVANFLTLLCRTDIAADYFSLSDQDDIWLPEKIAHAVQWLKAQPADKPALYCSRTTSVDETGKIIGTSPLFARKPGFGNALVQSLAGGNTMVMNTAARQLMMKAGADLQVPSHDWWIYILLSACGGNIFYDPRPHILYRQHGRNLIGANQGWMARLQRLQRVLAGQNRTWSDQYLAALQPLSVHFTIENQHLLQRFATLRQSHWPARIRGILNSGLYRQSMLSDMALWLAIVLQRL